MEAASNAQQQPKATPNTDPNDPPQPRKHIPPWAVLLFLLLFPLLLVHWPALLAVFVHESSTHASVTQPFHVMMPAHPFISFLPSFLLFLLLLIFFGFASIFISISSNTRKVRPSLLPLVFFPAHISARPKQTNQANKPSKQTKQTNQTNRQTSKQTNNQTSKQPFAPPPLSPPCPHFFRPSIHRCFRLLSFSQVDCCALHQTKRFENRTSKPNTSHFCAIVHTGFFPSNQRKKNSSP